SGCGASSTTRAITNGARSARSATSSSTVAICAVISSRSSGGELVKGTNARNHSYDTFIRSIRSIQPYSSCQSCHSFRDLLQESHVGIVENSDIRYSIPADGDARRPHDERPAGVALTVDARSLEHGGMHHA